MIRPLRMVGMLIFGVLVSVGATAKTSQEIMAENTRAVVFIETERTARDSDGDPGVIERGTGFIVSHDGFIVTASHVVPDGANRTYWAVVGQREGGVRFPLTVRERNESVDVALLQMPQSASCRYAITISAQPLSVPAPVVALGFPRTEGLTPSLLNIVNLTSSLGFLKGDGFLQVGNSGGPVFNQEGQVVGIVQGGTMVGGEANDIIPIALAVDLMQRRGVRAGIGSPVPFDTSCYAFCRHPSHGIESWGVVRDWPGVSTEYPDGRAWSGQLPGGHNRPQECAKLVAAALARNPGAEISVPEDNEHMGEESHGSWPTLYNYWCRGTLRTNPIYYSRQSSACDLWN